MKFKSLLYEKDQEQPQIVYITLNRPEKRNAISIGRGYLTQEIKDAMDMVNEDSDVKVAIFRGAGKGFCAGYDLDQVYRVYGGTADIRPYQRQRLMIDDTQVFGFVRAVASCLKVTIAQVHGWCIEAGMWLVGACDMALAAEDARFAHRGNRLAFGGFPVMPLELIGGHAKKVTELLITGRAISGLEAENVGIVTRAVPTRELAQETLALAKAVCVLPRDAVVMGKLARRHTHDQIGGLQLDSAVVYHTLGTNIRYGSDERELMFIRKREKKGKAKGAFHEFHQLFEDALDQTNYFKSYRPKAAPKKGEGGKS
ncbi:MAG: enoyl-CoA hydratase/isomerase family protein [Desulfarculaceae bacterium]|jgi:enoyl-CoA hydratase